MSLRISARWFVALLVAGVVGFESRAPVQAQGVLIVEEGDRIAPIPRPIGRPFPRETASYRIKELEVDASIRDQAARVQITQVFQNTGSRVVDASFVFPLPPEAVIDQLTLLVDGKEFEGKLLPKDEARSIYEDYVRRAQDPALLEWMGHGLYRTSVFPIPPGAERKVTIAYQQLVRQVDRTQDLLLPLATAKYSSQPLDQLKLRIAVETTSPLKTIYSPTYPFVVTRSDDHRAVLTYEAKGTLPGSDLRLFYDSGDQQVGASLLSIWNGDDDAGHFLLLVSPEFRDPSAAPLAKDVVLVVDRSGSMSGKKIEQVRESLKFVVERLNEGDRFNIVTYSGDVETFRPELEVMNAETRAAALGFAEGLFAGGSTNISDALATALPMLSDSARPSYLVFLTDGLPTAGETDEGRIVQVMRDKGGAHVRAISMGVGYDVNSRLLDRIADAGRGRSEYVRPEENIEAYVARLYESIASPVLTDVQLTIEGQGRSPADGPLVNRLQPASIRDLFRGEQLTVAGRYRAGGEVKVSIVGRVGDSIRTFEFPLRLSAKGEASTHRFVPRIWASRRIAEIITELDLKGKNDELVAELVSLSTTYGILTPYTSFLADDQPGAVAMGGRENVEAASRSLDLLSSSEGRGGFDQRRFRNDLSAAGAAPSGGGAPGDIGRPVSAAPLSAPADAFGLPTIRAIGSDEQRVVETVRRIGSRTMYRRGTLWIGSDLADVDPEKLPAELVRIRRFDDAYFELAAGNTDDDNALLAAFGEGDRVLVRLRGKLYLIE